ncbi:LysR substrate-binding domain-containing protein [Pseudomonas schmalbachii]|uniref:LysR family transcriptional regulator n=1 Tax=Pseudomonas schmalbachii TaxID=2816993 RepID=A0ABS3TW23_9PSED|nr:LysR substrate-binding domain-containing protein [Pseudomonas schmalbachii]MBO3277880.1 LysR family transcriptional regulator [Pseudomonas schmalbachii]
MRAFEAAARLGSYVAASRVLHVTQPAIGRHVKLLEEWLGVQLLERTPRGVTLTAAGQRYYAKISTALQQIADAGNELAPGSSMRWLKIRVVPAFAKRWLMPRLESLRQQRPGLKIAIEPNPTFTEVDGKSADLGIVYGMPGQYANCHATLLHPHVFPVCSPDFLASIDPIARAEDLVRHKLIHVDDGEWWNAWFAANHLDIRVSSDMLYISNDHALSMAEAGHGIALANEVLVKHELASGALVRPVATEVPLESYQLLIPAGRSSADIEWFLEWIAAALREEFPELCAAAPADQRGA